VYCALAPGKMSKKGKGNFIKFHGANNTSPVNVKVVTEKEPVVVVAEVLEVKAASSPAPAMASINSTSLKRNPEALLDDLSLSLNTISSTVKTWLPSTAPSATMNSSSSAPQTAVSWHQNGSGREPRLGLGAKPLSASASVTESTAENSGIFASLQLKKKLISATAVESKKSSVFASGVGKSKKHRRHGEVEEETSRFSSSLKKRNKA
jgi:hypothetical protein